MKNNLIYKTLMFIVFVLTGCASSTQIQPQLASDAKTQLMAQEVDAVSAYLISQEGQRDLIHREAVSGLNPGVSYSFDVEREISDEERLELVGESQQWGEILKGQGQKDDENNIQIQMEAM